MLREYYPKNTDLSKISINEMIKNLMELNTRPRKCLEYQTPFNLFIRELSLGVAILFEIHNYNQPIERRAIKSITAIISIQMYFLKFH